MAGATSPVGGCCHVITGGSELMTTKLRIILLVSITAVLMIFICVQAALLYRSHQQSVRASEQWANQQTLTIATDLSRSMRGIAEIAEQLAGELSSAACLHCDTESRLTNFYLRHSEPAALGVAFSAGQSGKDLVLYAPFIRSGSAGAALERLDSFYDYQAFGAVAVDDLASNPEAWFHTAQAFERQWLAPFYERALDRVVVRYTTPVFDREQRPIGLVFVDVGLDWLRDQVEGYDLRDNNYLRLHDAKGADLYHSLKGTPDFPHSGPASEPDSQVNQLQLTGTLVNQLTGETAWRHSQPVTGTDWFVETIISTSTRAPQTSGTSADASGVGVWSRPLAFLAEDAGIVWVAMLVVASVLLITCLRCLRRSETVGQLWIDTVVYTLVPTVGIIAIWVLEYGVTTEKHESSTILANTALVEQFQRDHALKAVRTHSSAPTYVPVGLFIQSLEFLSATNVSVSGYIWHRYAKGQESDYEVGTVFPEAIATNMQLAYEQVFEQEVVKGWYFEATLRQNFTPERFPFDHEVVWLRLWHERLGSNIVFVPDLKAYNSLNTRALPGMERDFVLSGWSLYRSYFSMRDNLYSTRQGWAGGFANEAGPELYFNIEIVRNFINPFLAHLFPLLVVLLMLFAIVITMSTDHSKKDLLGFNAAGVVASCSALLFVALISHVQIRDELAANSLVYLEYFYLITYLMILLVTANAVLLSFQVKIRFINHMDNLLPKLLFWPVLCSALFICTVWVFW
jgi:hypothetical protein